MRVYVPATIATLRQLQADGELAPLGGTAFALTPALRESYAAGDEEELSYAAMAEAGRASLRLLAAEQGDTERDVLARRAVISADVEGARLRPDLDAAVVRLSRPVQLSEVAAVHLDGAEAEDAVRAAVRVIDEADLGEHDAEFVLGEAADHELAWYATQELPFLLELL
ncbi:MAG: hypothetical protein M3Y19_04455 [Actinomycetota bacterium]|nr:hypothetical protein [Actinomycetota bacterium]